MSTPVGPPEYDTPPEREPQIPIDEVLSIDWERLAGLDEAARFRLLGDLAETAGSWIRDQRATIVEGLRAETGSDEAVARRLGVTRKALAYIGDGPIVAGARPQLLRRTAEILVEHATGQVAWGYANKALQELTKGGRPSESGLAMAAKRIEMASRNLNTEGLGAAELAVVRRGTGHAAEVASKVPQS